MPKRPAGMPDDQLRVRFAARLEEEAARRGWSDAAVAHRASAHRPSECVEGCHHYPMSANTIWRIKSAGKKAAGPPRRIDIDEAMAIAVGAFGYQTIDGFLADSARDRLSEGAVRLNGELLLATVHLKNAHERAISLRRALDDREVQMSFRSLPQPGEAGRQAALFFDPAIASLEILMTDSLPELAQMIASLRHDLAEIGASDVQ